MSIKGFDVTFKTGVKVEFDESVFTQEKRDEYARYFSKKLTTLGHHSRNIAQMVARDCVSLDSGANGTFFTTRRLDGYGYVLADNDLVESLTATGREWSGIRYRYDDQDFETEIESEYTPK